MPLEGLGRKGLERMLRVVKALLVLAAVVGAVIVAYAFLGDLTPERQEIDEPVFLDDAG